MNKNYKLNSKAQSEFSWLVIGLGIIFLIGTLSYIMSSFSDTTPQDYDGYLSPLVNFISSGHNFNLTIPVPILPDLDLNFNFNPFGILGGQVQNFLTSQMLGFTLIPPWLAIPLIILVALIFIYFIIRIIQGFIP